MSSNLRDNLIALTLRVRMPDGVSFDINGFNLLVRMSVTNIHANRATLEDVYGSIPSQAFTEYEQKLLEEFGKRGEAALMDWAASLDWKQVEQVANKVNDNGPDYQLGWKFGQKEVFKK